MKLSIITINRNNAAGLARTLESTFAAQPGFDDWEQVVVDGASSDGSFAALDRWKDDPHLGWHVSEPDAGIYNAMNKGASHARGDYLLFLNSGDELLPGVLPKVSKQLGNADILYGDLILADGNGTENTRVFPMANEIVPAWFLFWSLPHPASFISRKLLDSVGCYDESFRIVSDAKFFLDCVRLGLARMQHLAFPVSRFYLDGVSSDPRLQDAHRQERERMLSVVFGHETTFRAMNPPEGRPWIKGHVAEFAKHDSALADFLRRTSSAIVYLWSFAPTRWILKACNAIVSFAKRLVKRQIGIGSVSRR